MFHQKIDLSTLNMIVQKTKVTNKGKEPYCLVVRMVAACRECQVWIAIQTSYFVGFTVNYGWTLRCVRRVTVAVLRISNLLAYCSIFYHASHKMYKYIVQHFTNSISDILPISDRINASSWLNLVKIMMQREHQKLEQSFSILRFQLWHHQKLDQLIRNFYPHSFSNLYLCENR